MKEEIQFREPASNSSFVTYSCIGASVVLNSASYFMGKQAGLASRGKGILFLVANPWYMGAITCLFLQAIFWIIVLRRLPISSAYPYMSLVLPINLLTAYACFHETVGFHHIFGTLIMLAGIILIERDASAG